MSTDNLAIPDQENQQIGKHVPILSKNERYIYSFFVIYKKDGSELVSLRKNYVEDQKVMLSNMILAYPGYTLKTVVVDYRRFAVDIDTNS